MIDDKLHEECGVFGVFSSKKIKSSVLTYYGLYSLQHRGQESAGIVVNTEDGRQLSRKGMGLVSDVFDEEILENLIGSQAIGHVRYSTTGDSSVNNAQPLIGKCKLGPIAIAHNGNLVNSEIIKDLLEEAGTVFQTTSDSEVILNLISRSSKNGLEKSIVDTIHAIKGSYAIVILVQDKLIGIRDPNGIRPLCIGKKEESFFLASESCAIDAVGAKFVRDVAPGEIVIIDKDGIKSINLYEKTKSDICSFEYIYFARPDSVIDKINVYNSRENAGRMLCQESFVEADIVSGVPDSGIAAAIGFSKESNIPYGVTLIKNKYVGRTFISPTQELRSRAVSVKLNALKSNVEGKRIVLVDDSIVRGTTSKKLISILKNAGAKEVHLRISSPPVKFPCYFGIDTPSRKDLIASNKNVEEMRKMLGADSLAFISIKGLLKSLGGNQNFCFGCFNGIYPLSALRTEKIISEEKINENI